MWHDGDPLGVDAAEVRVLEQPDEIRFGPLLQRLERRRLKPHATSKSVRNLPDQTLEVGREAVSLEGSCFSGTV